MVRFDTGSRKTVWLDLCTRLGGRLLLFQVKASDYLVRGGRMFEAQHSQMERLIAICGRRQRFVYYALPDIGTTAELAVAGAILPSTWLLDVAQIPSKMGPPTVRNTSRLRRSGKHYIDMIPPTAVIHSEPYRVDLLQARVLARRLVGDVGITDPGGLLDVHREAFDHGFSRLGVGAIILPAQAT